MEDDSRQSAFIALSAVHKGAYADVALERVLNYKKSLRLGRL